METRKLTDQEIRDFKYSIESQSYKGTPLTLTLWCKLNKVDYFTLAQYRHKNRRPINKNSYLYKLIMQEIKKVKNEK